MNTFGLFTAVLLAFNWSLDANAATPTFKGTIPTRTSLSSATAAYAAYNYEITATFATHAPYVTPVVPVLPFSAQCGSVRDFNAHIAIDIGLRELFWSVTQNIHEGMLRTYAYYLINSEKARKNLENHLEKQEFIAFPKKLEELAFPNVNTLDLTLVECPTKLSFGITSPVTDHFSSAKVARAKPSLTVISFDIRSETKVTPIPWDELTMIIVFSLSIGRDTAKVSWARLFMLLGSKLVTTLVPTFAIKSLHLLICRLSYKVHSTLTAWHASVHHMFQAMEAAVHGSSNTIKADDAMRITKQNCPRQSPLEANSGDMLTEHGFAM